MVRYGEVVSHLCSTVCTKTWLSDKPKDVRGRFLVAVHKRSYFIRVLSNAQESMCSGGHVLGLQNRPTIYFNLLAKDKNA